MKEFWEQTLRDPLRDMTYLIGDPLFPDIDLSSGKGLEERGGRDLPGIGTTYAYLGFGVIFSVMHGEDIELSSMNLLRSGGSKLWLIIRLEHKEKLEGYMQ